MSAYYDHEHFWAPHEVCLRPQPDPIQPTQRQGLGQLFDAIAESIRALFGERTSKS